MCAREGQNSIERDKLVPKGVQTASQDRFLASATRKSASPKARQALFQQPIAFSSSFELRAQCKHCACEFLLQYNCAESFNPNSISEATHAADALHRIVVVIRSGELCPLRPNNVREPGLCQRDSYGA